MAGLLRSNPLNPRYFADDSGKAVYLTGSHTWNNFITMALDATPKPMGFDWYLDFLCERHHNFIRLWTWNLLCAFTPESRTFDCPWARTGPGLALDGRPRLDLTRFDDAWFTRLRRSVMQARERGIYVSVMLFEGWVVAGGSKAPRHMHCFAGANNINGIDLLANDRDGWLRDWVTLDNPAVTALQEAYVARVVDTLADLDNVLYEVCNEAGKLSHAWQEHIVCFIRDRQCATGALAQPVGVTAGNGVVNSEIFAGSADYIAPDGWAQPGKTNPYRDATATWGEAPDSVRSKVVLLDTDHIWGIGGSALWAWKAFLRGYGVLYMDPMTDTPYRIFHDARWPTDSDDHMRREMGVIRKWADRLDLNGMLPWNEVASTGYCLAQRGRRYVTLQPGDGTFDLHAAPGAYMATWHAVNTGQTLSPQPTTISQSPCSLAPPLRGPAVVLLEATA